MQFSKECINLTAGKNPVSLPDTIKTHVYGVPKNITLKYTLLSGVCGPSIDHFNLLVGVQILCVRNYVAILSAQKC